MTELTLKILSVYGVFFILALCGWLLGKLAHSAERVTAIALDGRHIQADIVGASKLRFGEWQRTKVRFYRADGEPGWEHGDGFSAMGVQRFAGVFLVSPPQ